MAGDWIKFESATPDKAEIWSIAEKLGIDPDAAVGKLLRIWVWFDQHTEGGYAPDISKNLLDRSVGVTGFCDAVIGVGWMFEESGLLKLPNFDRHNGQSAKKRADASRRQSKSRSSKSNKDVTKLCDKRNSIPSALRDSIYKRDNSQCVYCGFMVKDRPQFGPHSSAVLTLDHVVPITKGGEDAIGNLVTSCDICNNSKNNRTPKEAGMMGMFVTKDCDNVVTEALPREEKRREENIKDKYIAPRFKKPTIDDVTAYCQKRSNSVDPERFMSHYESNGWMVGKTPMKNWKASVRTWEKNNYEKNQHPSEKLSASETAAESERQYLAQLDKRDAGEREVYGSVVDDDVIDLRD